MMVNKSQNTEGPTPHDCAVHLHLKQTNRSCKDDNVNMLSREDKWYERGVNESIYVKLERLSLNRRWTETSLITTYNTELTSLLRELNNRSHLGSPRLRNSHEGQLDHTKDTLTLCKAISNLSKDTPTQCLKACSSSS